MQGEKFSVEEKEATNNFSTLQEKKKKFRELAIWWGVPVSSGDGAGNDKDVGGSVVAAVAVVSTLGSRPRSNNRDHRENTKGNVVKHV